jgi:hypothetical protein
MFTKKDEIEMYSRMYLLAFDKDRSFFYENDAAAIYAFLTDNYFGDKLHLQIKLLVNLLARDADVCPRGFKKDLLKKSDEFSKHLNQNPI